MITIHNRHLKNSVTKYSVVTIRTNFVKKKVSIVYTHIQKCTDWNGCLSSNTEITE